MKPADVSTLRVLRRARDRIDRDYADLIDIPPAVAGWRERYHGPFGIKKDTSRLRRLPAVRRAWCGASSRA